MSPIRLDDFEANLRFQVALIEVSEGHHKTFEVRTDFPEFMVYESKDIIQQQNDSNR